MNYWLMKVEPDTYSIDDLARDGVYAWDGVRNYQARNFMRDAMRVGDKVLFYASNAKPSGVVGLAKIASVPRADPTQFDQSSHYFDQKATTEKPRWVLVDVAFVKKFAPPVTLAEIKLDPTLAGMLLVRPGQRLSIQSVTKKHYEHIVQLA
ncbi:EVE domain-containing protein [Candidatus Kaiserbacteria bacterium RIFCSPHIGHO2_02_FULL_50_50]|uniref:EVE domain-containing protein n=1 Tax=Candidatus Kaiserbacteria bacterium RIFCSPHIGHO2_02_FULL_50_50 TaxID=1798492 RepID=A0A1F6DEQ1_9BACT|nr:MAG: EVE domain-containing protein [Candidatus Kaiserbacteria bacterium RIFCSPHIGHO2_02_FULL_50_50]OGG89089.1 MAG: EVE domain-containing protein [Candidatus Kaiserbacteria bacterium RIFCSPLOWO2_12_FULL_50_10]